MLPKVVGPSHTSALVTAPGAHHYRFIGVEITQQPGAYVYNLVLLGAGETSLAELPSYIILDRVYVHGHPTAGTVRGLAFNGQHLAVIDSTIAEIKDCGGDSQAIAGWNGAGPFKIANNYLEAAGENVMFGGADPAIPNLVPADIEVRHNHFFKPLAWKPGDPSFQPTPASCQGIAWTVKYHLELKNARRVLLDGNLFETQLGRLCHPVHRAQPGRRLPVVHGRGCDVHQQPRAPYRLGGEPARHGLAPSQWLHRARADPQ